MRKQIQKGHLPEPAAPERSGGWGARASGASGEARDRSGPQSMEGTGRLHRAGTRIG